MDIEQKTNLLLQPDGDVQINGDVITYQPPVQEVTSEPVVITIDYLNALIAAEQARSDEAQSQIDSWTAKKAVADDNLSTLSSHSTKVTQLQSQQLKA